MAGPIKPWTPDAAASASSVASASAEGKQAQEEMWGMQNPNGAQGHLGSLNQSGPTEQKKFFDENKHVWTNPTGAEVNNWGLVSQFTDPNNRPQTTNNSQGWFDQYRNSMPSISSEPGFGAYFDNAKNRAAESINQSMAARGAYGSSAANDQTSRAFTDLEGQRALKEADYNLARLGEQRAWQGQGGQLAGQADNNALNLSQDEQNWTKLLSQMGIDASRLGLDRTNAGADAAGAAGVAERTRGQDYFTNQLAMGDRMADLYKTVMLPTIDNDAGLALDASSGGVAAGNAEANNERTNANDAIGYANTAASIYNGLR